MGDAATRTSAPTPCGPPTLWPAERERGRRRASTACPTAHWRRCGTDAVLRAQRRDLGDRLERADLVVGPHHGDERDPLRAALVELGLEPVEVEAAERVDGQTSGRRPSALPRCSTASRRGARRRCTDTASATTTPRGRGRCPDHGEVVGLGAAEVNTTSTGLAPSTAAISRATLDDAPGATARRDAATTGCRHGELGGHGLERLRGASASSRRGRGTPGSSPRGQSGRTRRRGGPPADPPLLTCRGVLDAIGDQPLRLATSSVSWGTTRTGRRRRRSRRARRSAPRRPLFTATIVLEVCMPARCWIAPEMPLAM